MKIAFHSCQLGLRGTEVALYDYAHFNEEILRNTSIIVAPLNAKGHHPLAIEKFKRRFPVYFYETESDLEKILQNEKVGLFYSMRAGRRESPMPSNVRTAIHAVFQFYEPHGDVYAYISEWLSKKMTNCKYPFVPYMVTIPESDENLRKELNIPETAVVFGRHGGLDTFDIEIARRAVYRIAVKFPDKYFIFLNTYNFMKDKRKYYHSKYFSWLGNFLYPAKELPNIIFLKGTDDLVFKRKFINTCDCMIHARRRGESFGLAIGEFSICGKPIITCKTNWITDTAHFGFLGDNAYYYSSRSQLETILKEFCRPVPRVETEYAAYTPEIVMKKFSEVFLK